MPISSSSDVRTETNDDNNVGTTSNRYDQITKISLLQDVSLKNRKRTIFDDDESDDDDCAGAALFVKPPPHRYQKGRSGKPSISHGCNEN